MKNTSKNHAQLGIQIESSFSLLECALNQGSIFIGSANVTGRVTVHLARMVNYHIGFTAPVSFVDFRTECRRLDVFCHEFEL